MLCHCRVGSIRAVVRYLFDLRQVAGLGYVKQRDLATCVVVRARFCLVPRPLHACLQARFVLVDKQPPGRAESSEILTPKPWQLPMDGCPAALRAAAGVWKRYPNRPMNALVIDVRHLSLRNGWLRFKYQCDITLLIV